MDNLCLDRACMWQEMGPHYAHLKDADFLSIIIDVAKANTDLEHLKANHGRRCAQCSRLLIPTDEDHSFCEDCWGYLMEHEFDEDKDKLCAWCGEPKENKMHVR